MPLNAKLVVVGGEVKTAEIKLRLPSTIGRGRGATIMLPHPLVSRQHCELYEAEGKLMVRDLGSLNGTFVNNERVSEAPLPPGELLTVGAVTFRAVYETDESTGPPSTAPPKLATGKISDTAMGGTVRAPVAKEPTTPEPAAEADDADFDFDQPLMPVDDEARIPVGRAGAKTDATVEDVAAGGAQPKVIPSGPQISPVATTPVSKDTTAQAPAKPDAKTTPAPAKPAAPAPAAPAAPAAAKGEERTIDLSGLGADEEEEERGGDDDLNDFLKSLSK